jgi:hypothetical protein
MNVELQMCDYTSNNWSIRIVRKGLRKYLEAIPGKHSTDSLQQTAIPQKSHITRKVPQCEA